MTSRIDILKAGYQHQQDKNLEELNSWKITKEEFAERQKTELEIHEKLIKALKQEENSENKKNNSST